MSREMLLGEKNSSPSSYRHTFAAAHVKPPSFDTLNHFRPLLVRHTMRSRPSGNSATVGSKMHRSDFSGGRFRR